MMVIRKDQLLQISGENVLETLYDYFINEIFGDPIPFGRWEKLSVFLELLGGSGGIYAWPPAWEYAKNKQPWLAYSLVITNPVSNVLFLTNATDNLFDYIAIELSSPKQLKDIIKLPSKKALIAKYIKMILGSIVCAGPFAVATYLFPLPHCESKACLAAIVTHSLLANTILHAISWNFILTPAYWYYRLPILPFEKMYSLIHSRFLSEDRKEYLNIKKRKMAIYQKYKNLLGEFFINGAQKIVDDYISNRDSKYKDSTLNEIFGGETSLVRFAELVTKDNSKPANNPSALRQCVSTTNGLLKSRVMGVVGAIFMTIGCAGWIANSFYVGELENLDIAENIGVGILPAYSMAVLCAFYGSATLVQVYDYLTSWNGGIKEKFSLEARLYPKSFAIFLLLNVYLSAFSYGVAQQLINTVFGSEMWDDYRPYMNAVAIPAMQILSFVPLFGLFNNLIRKSVAKFGDTDNDHTKSTRLLVKASLFGQRLQQIKGKNLIASIENYNEQQHNSLNISPIEFRNDKETLEKLNTRKQELRLFWKRPKSEIKLEEKSSLLRNTFERGNKHQLVN